MSEKRNTVRVAGIIKESIVDGPGIRFVVFAQGCPHGCRGCHNEAALDFSGGAEYDIDDIVGEIMKNPLLSGVTFSGGEPFCQPGGFLNLALKLKEKGMNVLSYTGYEYEELAELSADNENIKKLLDNIDILIDGRFVREKRDLTLRFKGSSNQRYIDMNATRSCGAPVTADDL
jgi:anaerobic ribonucleoside-triphosphate reductase activating protein